MSFFPPVGTICNSASPWASSFDDLSALYTSGHTQAVTTRTATLHGFAEDRSLHQVAFFGSRSESTINSHGYSPFPLSSYIQWIETLLHSDLPKKTIIFSITGNLSEVEEMLITLQEFANKLETVIGIEMNASCPNIPGHPPPAYNQVGLESYFSLLSKYSGSYIKVGMKLPPFTYADQFNAVILALQKFSPPSTESSAHPISFLTSTNTLGSGLVFEEQAMEVSDGATSIEDELKGKEYALPAEGFGGLAGLAIHQLSLGNVNRLSTLLKQSPDKSLASIAIIGVGGVEDADGVKRMRKAGAIAVACATAFGREGVAIFSKLSM